MSDQQIEGLELIGLTSETLNLYSLAQALIDLNYQFMDEKTKREDLQEQLFSMRNSITNNIKPLISSLEGHLDDLNRDCGGLFSSVKQIKQDMGQLSTQVNAMSSEVSLLSKENDVLFDQVEKITHQQAKMVMSSQHSHHSIGTNVGFTEPTSQTQQTSISKTTTTLPSQSQQQSQTQQPPQLATPAKKVYIPKSQRTPGPITEPESNQSTNTQQPEQQQHPQPQQLTTTTPSKPTLEDGAKNILKRSILSSLGQRANLTITNTGDNAHDRLTKSDRPGVRFYSRAQLYAYRPSQLDTIVFQQQQDIIPSDHFKTNLHPSIACAISRKDSDNVDGDNDPECNGDNIHPEQGNDLNNNNTINLPSDYTINTNKSTTPLIISHLPRYLTMEHAENRGSWIGTPRGSREQAKDNMYPQQLPAHQRPQQSSSSQHSRPQQRQQPITGPLVGDGKWDKISDNEREFLEFQRWKQQFSQNNNNNNNTNNNNNNRSNSNTNGGFSNFNNNQQQDEHDPYGPVVSNNRGGNRSNNNYNNNNHHNNNQRNNSNQYNNNDDDTFGNFRSQSRVVVYGSNQQQYDRYGKPIPINKVKQSGSYLDRMKREENDLQSQMDHLHHLIADHNDSNSNDLFIDEDTKNDDGDGDDDDDAKSIIKSKQIYQLQHIWLNNVLGTIQSKLNKITANKVEQFANEIATILSTNDPGGFEPGITNETQLGAVIHTIVNRATKEVGMVKIYAELCYLISSHPKIQSLVFTKDDEAVTGIKGYYGPLSDDKFPLTFRLVVILYCQFLIEQYTKLKNAQLFAQYNDSQGEPLSNNITEGENGNNNNNNYINGNVGQRITLQHPMEGRVFCQFLGELYKFAFLPSKACSAAMDCLFSTGDEEDVLAMVAFASSVVPQYLVNHIAKTKYNIAPKVAFPLINYLPRFNSIMKTRHYTITLKNVNPVDNTTQSIDVEVQVSQRVKFLIMDFIDLYSKK